MKVTTSRIFTTHAVLNTALRYLVSLLLFLLVLETLYLLVLNDQDDHQARRTWDHLNIHTPASLPPLVYFDEAVERTLLSPDRKPKVITASTTNDFVSRGVVSRAWELTGVIKSDGKSYGIFSEKSGVRREKVEQGQRLDGWTLEEVSPEEVVFSRNDQKDTVQMLVSAPKKKPRSARKKAKTVKKAKASRVPSTSAKKRSARMTEEAEREIDEFIESMFITN